MTDNQTQAEAVRADMRAALCKRLRETGMQTGSSCDGRITICGVCDRHLDAIEEARRAHLATLEADHD